MITVTRFKLPQ